MENMQNMQKDIITFPSVDHINFIFHLAMFPPLLFAPQK